jgi:beta-lactamase class A
MIFSRIVLFVAFLLTVMPVDPVRAAQGFPPLEQCVDSDLQSGLETSLHSLHLDTAVRQKRLSVTLVDVTDPQDPRLAEVNGNDMMYAASLPKIAILLGAFERIAQGDLEWNPATEETLIRMIRNSSNTAATDMLNQVGKEYLADLLQSPRYRLYDPQKNGGLWVGKEYGKNPAWQRDPLHQLSHGATALQVARFYYLLDTGRLVSPESSREMKEILGHPAIHHKFVKGLEQNRPGATVFRKSGTWKEFHSDSALVEHRGRRYIAVALAKSPQGGEWLSRLITALDDLIVRPPSRLLRLAGKSAALR